MPNTTILERVKDNPEELLFKSDKFRVFAAVDTYPRLPYQCLVAPFQGAPGEVVHFNDQDLLTQLRLHTVANVLSRKILQNCTRSQRVITRIEGFGIPDHPHIVVGAAEQKQGVDIYTGQSLGIEAVQKTIEAIRFEPEEAKFTESLLDGIWAE